MIDKEIHIALDFDKTLAYHESGWKGRTEPLPEPITPILNKLKNWLNEGYKVTIFTARVSPNERSDKEILEQKIFIIKFLKANGLPLLPITAIKSNCFTHFIDDRAYNVKRNKGVISDEIDI